MVGQFDNDGSLNKMNAAVWMRLRGAAVMLSFIFFVVIPVAVYAVYLIFVATPQYESEFRIQIRAPTSATMPSFGAMLGLSGATSSASDSGYAVTQYLASKNAVFDLEKAVGLRKRYSKTNVDYLSRLPNDASIEQVQRFWVEHSSAKFETTSGTVVFTVSAFSPQDAKDIAIASLDRAESMLNRMTHRVRQDAVQYAAQEVASAERNLMDVDAELLKVRNRTGIIDVPKQVSAYMTRISNLQSQVDAAQAEVFVRRRYLSSGAPNMQLAEDRLKALRSALADAEGAAVVIGTAKGSQSLAVAANEFDQMEGRKLFAERRLQAALTNLNSAESDAQRQQMYMERIVSPQTAEEATYPRPLRGTLTFLAFAMAIWALVLILGLAVRDHLPHSGVARRLT